MLPRTPHWKHWGHCALFLFIIVFVAQQMRAFRLTQWVEREEPLDPLREYGPWGYLFLCIVRLMPLLAVPQQLFNLVGLFRYNTFPEKVSLKGSPLLAPLICFRVVTRGDFPDLVKGNVVRNIRTCVDAGLENFIVEVATDKSIGMPEDRRVREVVIPRGYRTKTGALFKARALQYCLEDGVNILGSNEWIVHLHEENLLPDPLSRPDGPALQLYRRR